MRKINIFLLLLALLMIAPMPAEAKKKRRKKAKASKITNVVDVYGGAGYSSFLHNIDGTKVPGGGEGMLGFGYMLRHKNGFNARIGLEAMMMNGSTTMHNQNYVGNYLYNGPGNWWGQPNWPINYEMQFPKYTEQQNRLSVGVPLMFGYEFDRYYFLVGAKALVGLMSNYNTKVKVHAVANDPMISDELQDMVNHDLGDYKLRSHGPLKIGMSGLLDVTGSVEAGICLDEWMPATALSVGSGKNKVPISYRVGLYADYGFLDLNSNTRQGLLFGEVQGDGIFVEDVRSIPFRSILETDRAVGHALNSLVIGAKFTVLFNFKKPIPPEKRRKRPRPKPKVVRTEPPFFYCVVVDDETEQFLDANIFIYNLDEKRDTVWQTLTDIKDGFAENQMKDDQYGIKISRDGYVDYIDTLYQIDSDTLYVGLQPIKKNTVVILRNLFFDTDKTVIRNISTESLEEMYKLLVDNPEMRIEITGHTDNVGSAAYNRRLSKGRAKAVYDEMVKRGIDPSRMTWDGKGESEPIESNDTKEGRAENRRVQFRIL